MRKYIPNAFTLANLFCGCIAVVFVVDNNFIYAALFVFLGIFFDFFDGFFARKFNAQSELGLQLDSLADMVTSGLAPGLIMFKLLGLADSNLAYNHSNKLIENLSEITGSNILPFIGFSITLASAYRLAKFNVDTEQQSFFKGLPTPANALLIVSLPLIIEFENNDFINAIILSKSFLITLTIISSYILISNIKLFALKFKNYSFKDNAVRYIFILLSIVFLIVMQFTAIPVIILVYVIMSVLDNMTSK